MTGVAYSLFAGQPLTILGSTGPVLVFEKILFKFCKYVSTSIIFNIFIIPARRFVLIIFSSLPLPHQGLPAVLSVPEDLHWPVDGPAVFAVGGHGCQLSGVLHHSVHRGGLCRPHLPHLHLRGFGEALPPGRSLPLQCTERSGQTHTGVVSNIMFTLHFTCMVDFSFFFPVHCSSLIIYSCHSLSASVSSLCGFALVVSLSCSPLKALRSHLCM